MAVTSTTVGGVNCWQFSGAVTDAELKTAWAALVANGVYTINRAIYLDNTADLTGCSGGFLVNFGTQVNPAFILHTGRDKTKSTFNNFTFLQSTGLSVGSRGSFVRTWSGTTLVEQGGGQGADGVSQKGGGTIYGVAGNPGGGDPRYLNEMAFAGLEGATIYSQEFAEQELQPSIGATAVLKGLTFEKCFGFPQIGTASANTNVVVYRSTQNTQNATQYPVRQYPTSSRWASICYVDCYVTRNNADITTRLADYYGSSATARCVTMVLNNYTRDSWFGTSKTAFSAMGNWNAANQFYGGVLKKLQFVGGNGAVIRAYDSRSTTAAQKCAFLESGTVDFFDASLAPTTDSNGKITLVLVGALATGGSASITRYTGQKYTFQKFGYRVSVTDVDMTQGGDNDLSAFTPVIPVAQDGIVRTQAAINAATSINSFQDLLEELHVLAIGLSGSASYAGAYGGNLFTYSGGVLTTSFASVAVDPTAAAKIAFNSATNAMTIKSTTLTNTVDVTKWVNSGAIALENGAQIQGVYQSSAGTSTVWQFQEIEIGTSLAVYDSMGVTKYYQGEVTTAGIFSFYIPPGVAETYTYAVEKYPYKREVGAFPANAGGVLFYVPGYVEDVGISEPNKAVVVAYTSLETPSKVYDRTAVFRLTELGIKIGQIFTRSGSALEVQSGYNHLINKDAVSVIGVSAGVITTKSTSYAGDSKYTTEIALVPATVTANTNEVITIQIEDANGNSQVTIQGGSGSFTLWKIPNATPEDSYATGENLGTFGNVIYRFLSAPGYKIIIRDDATGYRQICPMDKGNYVTGLFFGNQVQLAQSAEVTQINSKVDVLKVQVETLMAELEAVKGAGFASTDSLVAINSNVNSLPLLSEIEASTMLAKESSITALGSPLQADDYVAPDNSKIATIDTNVASIGSLVADLPLLSEIEASTVLAKEASITALGTPLQADDYVVPDNATIAEIQTKLDTLQNVDLSGVPADVWAYAVRTLTTAAGLTEAQVALLEGIKTQTDLLPAQPAGVGDAMTLTTAYDASKTAASQSSVTALGSPMQAGDYVEPDNAGIAVLVTDVGNVPLAVRQELATELARIDVEVSSRSDLTVEDIPEGLTVAEIEASTVLAKEKSVQNTMAIAVSRIAF